MPLHGPGMFGFSNGLERHGHKKEQASAAKRLMIKVVIRYPSAQTEIQLQSVLRITMDRQVIPAMFAFTNGVAPHGHNKDPISMVNLQTIKVVHLCRSVLMATPLQSVLHSMEEGGPNPAIQGFIVGTVQDGLKKGQTSMVKRPMIKAVMRYQSVLTEIP